MDNFNVEKVVLFYIFRDQLFDLQPSTGYRFNGKGYAILDARSHPLQVQTEVKLKFKTSSSEGLMFLVGKGNTFMSIEMKDGKFSNNNRILIFLLSYSIIVVIKNALSLPIYVYQQRVKHYYLNADN